MLANWITLARFPLLLITLLALYQGAPPVRLAGVGLLFIGLMLDTVDGVVARKTRTTSLFGSVLDIAADRTYELVLWFCFADLGMIPMVIPLIVIARTALTDAFRSIGVAQGTAPFDQHRTRLGRFLVGSTVMRAGYSASKTVTFCGLGLVHALTLAPAPPSRFVTALTAAFQVTAWAALGFCVLRGVPVIVHAGRHHWARSNSPGREVGVRWNA